MNSRYLTESWAEQRTHCTPNIRGSAHWWWHFRAGFEVYPPGIDFDSGLKMGIPWNGNLCRENHLNTIKNWTRFFVDACFFLEKTYTTLYNHQWWQPLNMENESRMINHRIWGTFQHWQIHPKKNMAGNGAFFGEIFPAIVDYKWQSKTMNRI
jgi:hypothetical protein